MASNDFWLHLEQGLTNYCPAYGLKAGQFLRMGFTFLKGYEKRKGEYMARDAMLPPKLDLLSGPSPESLVNPDLEERDPTNFKLSYTSLDSAISPSTSRGSPEHEMG